MNFTLLFASLTCVVVLSLPVHASMVLTNAVNLNLANHQIEGGDDLSSNPNVVNGTVDALLPYSPLGTFNCCGANFLGSNLDDGDIGAGVASDGTYAIPNAGPASLSLDFGSTVTLSSIAIYDGYANRDDGTYTLTDRAGTILGGWTISGTTGNTNSGVDSFWLVFATPVTTDGLVFATTSTEIGGTTNSYREIQVFGVTTTPEPSSIALLALALGMFCLVRHRTRFPQKPLGGEKRFI